MLKVRGGGRRIQAWSYLCALCVWLTFAPFAVRAQRLHELRQNYAERYKALAIEQMRLHGVPASITLAQGMLESGNGLSRLATQANNHFGIKCHKGWQGRKTYEDDDSRGECFRVYRSVEQSFEDHSLFLRGGRRYAFLFNLSPTDYKGWAHGLKKAGYATDPAYATRLISIIEEEGLAQYDTGVEISIPRPPVDARAQRREEEEQFFVKLEGKHKVYTRNRVEYTVVQPNDTYASLSLELDMLSWELAKYNEWNQRVLPEVGSIVYIQPKRRLADVRTPVHVVEAGETLYSISQQYAVKLSGLARRNHLNPDDALEAGQLIYLRGKAQVK